MFRNTGKTFQKFASGSGPQQARLLKSEIAIMRKHLTGVMEDFVIMEMRQY